MRNKIIGYGELLLRLTPHDHGSLIEQTDILQMAFAGAEANIIADLAVLGHSTEFVSALPKNPLGFTANRFLNQFGIGTDAIFWDDGRLGTYYIEHGTSLRGSRVTYDRQHASVTKANFSEKYWDTLFKKTSYFVLTGITPALSQICRDNITVALQAAKNNNVKVVFDLNFRRTLWKKEEAKHSFTSILPFVNILIGNIGSAFDVFNIQTEEISDFESLIAATKTATEGLENLGDFDVIAMTLRLQKNANENILGGMVKTAGEYYFSKRLPTEISDRLGGGDAFTASLLHGLINNWKPNTIVNFSTAAFAITQTLKGDINYTSEKELLEIASGNVKGYVRR
ncbi:sugar kinase [Aurantibacter sp.]|uniref:sugar kinase n=1 Tax=Aurantibacter sp. TaxID=2807103 RepID=UPI00326676CD